MCNFKHPILFYYIFGLSCYTPFAGVNHTVLKIIKKLKNTIAIASRTDTALPVIAIDVYIIV